MKFTYLFLFFVSVFIVSCSSDDDNPASSSGSGKKASPLVGVWTYDTFKMSTTGYSDEYDLASYYKLEFKADGTFSGDFYTGSDKMSSDEGTYTFDDYYLVLDASTERERYEASLYGDKLTLYTSKKIAGYKYDIRIKLRR